MWFAPGLTVLLIGSAYLLASFFLLAMGMFSANGVAALGMLLMVAGGALAIGSALLARPVPREARERNLVPEK